MALAPSIEGQSTSAFLDLATTESPTVRSNLPVSQCEYDVMPESATDSYSRVANAAAASIGSGGFERDEALGQPCKPACHPDTAAQAFAMLKGQTRRLIEAVAVFHRS